MSTSPGKRSIAQVVIAGVFALLSVGFLFRFLQYGLDWVRHVTDGDKNFKALTAWALIYTVVCLAIAAVAWKFPPDEPEEAEPQSKV